MPIPAFDSLEAIRFHGASLAEAAEGNLGAPVEHCPGWSVADLVWHLAEVHWFWATIVEELLVEPPGEARRPARPDDHSALLSMCRANAEHLVQVLATAEPAAACWTWAPHQKDVAFVLRHQVQEAAVHHWDAAHAAGSDISINSAVAADAVDEFLKFSVSSDDDPAEPAREPLGGSLALRCSDLDAAWIVSDGTAAGTIRAVQTDDPSVPGVTATASDLILWLYGRVAIDTEPLPIELLPRFKGLLFTD
ncbi:MAG: maleylpyruvate isomerase family mycothiol-dependent enzyme [Acidimicrobiales bacterium]